MKFWELFWSIVSCLLKLTSIEFLQKSTFPQVINYGKVFGQKWPKVIPLAPCEVFLVKMQLIHNEIGGKVRRFGGPLGIIE